MQYAIEMKYMKYWKLLSQIDFLFKKQERLESTYSEQNFMANSAHMH